MLEHLKPLLTIGEHVESAILTRKVLEYTQLMKELVPTARIAQDWAPLANFVAVDTFERVGTFLEVQNWQEYVAMLGQWASRTERFETTVRRLSELPRLVYFEIEERHFRNDAVTVVNSMTVFSFDYADRIQGLNVYLQQPR